MKLPNYEMMITTLMFLFRSTEAFHMNVVMTRRGSICSTIANDPRKSNDANHKILKAYPLDDIDTMCLMNTADYCIEDECSIEELEDVIARLYDQREFELAKIKKMDDLLDGLLEKKEVQEITNHIHTRMNNNYDETNDGNLVDENQVSDLLEEIGDILEMEKEQPELTSSSHRGTRPASETFPIGSTDYLESL